MGPCRNATASRQALRRAGQKPGPDIGSVRDQANKTGESKDKIHRSNTRFETLGSSILESIIGTSLDRAVELDAMRKLPEAVRNDLARRAVGGEAVSARKVLREAKGRAKEVSQHQTPVSDLKQAYEEFCDWVEKYAQPLNSNGLWEQIEQFADALNDVIYPDNVGDPDDEEDTSEINAHSKKKWFNFRKGST
jgi:hypothetical protein